MGVGLVSRALVPQPVWTMIHVVTLGVLTNAILQWSWYFSRALLHLPPGDHRAGRDATSRMIVFNVALVGLVAGMWTATAWATVAGAGAIGGVIAWHGLALLSAARTRLASRFAVVIRYYIAAAGFLVIGCVLAGFLTVAMFDAAAPAWVLAAREDLTLAHVLVNVGGWIGLSMAGTLVTLGPTMLRTRMDPAAVDRALAALPWLVVAIVLAGASAVAGLMPGIGVGLVVFIVASFFGMGLPLVRTAIARSPHGYATWATTAGLAWATVGVGAVAFLAFTAPGAAALSDGELPWLALLGAGGLVQVFFGALTYLLPVVVGGGPAAMRVGIATLEVAWPIRIALRNIALTILAATGFAAPPLQTAWSALVVGTYAVDIALFSVAGARQAKARRATYDSDAAEPDVVRVPTEPRRDGGPGTRVSGASVEPPA